MFESDDEEGRPETTGVSSGDDGSRVSGDDGSPPPSEKNNDDDHDDDDMSASASSPPPRGGDSMMSESSSSRRSWSSSSSARSEEENNEEKLGALRRWIEAKDAVVEPGLFEMLAEYEAAGGSMEEAAKALARNYVGYSDACRVLSEWLGVCGVSKEEIESLEWDAARAEIGRKLDARALDERLLIDDEEKDAARMGPPAWLRRLLDSHRGRELLLGLARDNGSCDVLRYAVRRMAENGHVDQLLKSRLDLTKDLVSFEMALVYVLSRNDSRLARLVGTSVPAFGYAVRALRVLDWREKRHQLAKEFLSKCADRTRGVRAALPPCRDKEAAVALVANKNARAAERLADADENSPLFREPLVLDALLECEAYEVLAKAVTAPATTEALRAERAATAAALAGVARGDAAAIAAAPIASLAYVRRERSLSDASAVHPAARGEALQALAAAASKGNRQALLGLVDLACAWRAPSVLDVVRELSLDDQHLAYFLFRLVDRAKPPYSPAFAHAATRLLSRAKRAILISFDRHSTTHRDKVNLQALASHLVSISRENYDGLLVVEGAPPLLPADPADIQAISRLISSDVVKVRPAKKIKTNE